MEDIINHYIKSVEKEPKTGKLSNEEKKILNKFVLQSGFVFLNLKNTSFLSEISPETRETINNYINTKSSDSYNLPVSKPRAKSGGKSRKTKGRKTKGRKTKGRKTKGRKTKGRKTRKIKQSGGMIPVMATMFIIFMLFVISSIYILNSPSIDVTGDEPPSISIEIRPLVDHSFEVFKRGMVALISSPLLMPHIAAFISNINIDNRFEDYVATNLLEEQEREWRETIIREEAEKEANFENHGKRVTNIKLRRLNIDEDLKQQINDNIERGWGAVTDEEATKQQDNNERRWDVGVRITDEEVPGWKMDAIIRKVHRDSEARIRRLWEDAMARNEEARKKLEREHEDEYARIRKEHKEREERAARERPQAVGKYKGLSFINVNQATELESYFSKDYKILDLFKEAKTKQNWKEVLRKMMGKTHPDKCKGETCARVFSMVSNMAMELKLSGL